MKTVSVLIFVGTLLFSCIAVCKDKPQPVKDEATAVTIAERALSKLYGHKKIESERPFKATLQDGVWIVVGTLHCSDGKGGTTTICVGGSALAKISQANGKVLSMTHTM